MLYVLYLIKTKYFSVEGEGLEKKKKASVGLVTVLEKLILSLITFKVSSI